MNAKFGFPATTVAIAVAISAPCVIAQTITDPNWTFETSYQIPFHVWTASYNPNDGYLYVGGSDVGQLDLSTGTTTAFGAGSIGGGLDVDPADGDIFYVIDTSGSAYRIPYGSWNSTLVDEKWVSNFDGGDDDGVGLHVLPASYGGPGLSSWGGRAVSIDRGSSSPSDSIYSWRVDSGATIPMDWVASPGDITKIHDEEPGAPAAGGNMVDGYDVWGDANGIYIADQDADNVWKVTGNLIDSGNPALGYQLEAVNNAAFPEGPTGIAGDPVTDKLFVVSQSENVYRLDKTTGDITLVGSGFSNLGKWGGIEISDSGDRLWIVDDGTNTVYQYARQVSEPAGWAVDASGDWNNNANWFTGNVPNATSESAVFGAVITAPRVVFTETDVTVKSVWFNSVNKYAVAGVGNLSLDDGDNMDARVDVTVGSHEFQLPVSFADNGTVSTAAGAQVDFNGALNLRGNTITKEGPGTMNVNNRLTQGGGSILVNDGTFGGFGSVGGSLTANDGGTVAPGNSPGMLTVKDDFTLGAGSRLEIEIGGLLAEEEHDVLDVQGDASLDGMLDIVLIDGFTPSNGNTFDVVFGDRITANGLQLIGDDADFTFDILPGDILRLTFGGSTLDADFDTDGDVDGDDFLIWQTGFGNGTTHEEGDADRDGNVDGDDFLIWQSQFGSTIGSSAGAVPEPSAISILIAIGILVFPTLCTRSTLR